MVSSNMKVTTILNYFWNFNYLDPVIHRVLTEILKRCELSKMGKHLVSKKCVLKFILIKNKNFESTTTIKKWW